LDVHHIVSLCIGGRSSSSSETRAAGTIVILNHHHRPQQTHHQCTTKLFFPFLSIPSTLAITRVRRRRRLLKKLPGYTDLTLDSVVLGNNSLKCMHDMAQEG